MGFAQDNSRNALRFPNGDTRKMYAGASRHAGMRYVAAEKLAAELR